MTGYARSGYPGVHTGNSVQARLIEATGADVASIEAIRDGLAAAGWTERTAEADQWLAVARDDHAAAVAGYPETAADKLALAERETQEPEAGQ